MSFTEVVVNVDSYYVHQPRFPTSGSTFAFAARNEYPVPYNGPQNRTIMSILRNQIEIRFFCMVKGYSRIIRILPVILFSLTVFLSCTDRERVPEGVLTKDQMVNLMIDFYVSEQKVSDLKLPSDSSKALFRIFEGKILDEAAIADSVFEQSFYYYVDRPKEMEQIYAAIVDSLQLMEQRASD